MKKVVVVIPDIPMLNHSNSGIYPIQPTKTELFFEGEELSCFNTEEGLLIVQENAKRPSDHLAVFNKNEWKYWKKITQG